MKNKLFHLTTLLLALAGAHLDAAPLGTAFTYQGRLTDGANPANGTIPMVFGLWDADMFGNNVGSPSSFPSNVLVANGLFSIDLDFGAAAFRGDARWLEIRVNGTLMTTRQRVAPTPNALYASMAGTANGVAANGVSGISLQAGSLQFNGPTYLHENTLYFGSDASHGVGWRSTYAGAAIDGPVLFGYGGGGLGSTVPDVLALSWNRQGNVGIGTANPLSKLQVGQVGNSGVGVFAGDRTPFGAALFQTDVTTPGTHAWFAENGNRVFSVEAGGHVTVGNGAQLWGNWDGGQPALTLSGVNPGIIFDGDEEINNFKLWSIYLGGNGPGGPGNLEFYVSDKDERTTDHVLTMSRHGNVGIGTTAPAARLQVNQVGNSGVGVFAGNRTPFGAALFETDVTTPGTHAWFAENGNRVFSVEGGGNGYFRGNVGIGTGTPTQALDVRDGTGAGGQGGHIHVGGTGANGDPKLIKFGDGDFVHIGENGADDTMELKATRFIFTGGDVTVPVLTITGGADLAEPFQMKEEQIEKGSVVVIDDEHAGRLKLSTRAYDTQVAGIVSGANGINPGIALKQEGALDQGQNVALTGRVYVQADASFGAIKPGDLLTTSDTPGHAMKVMAHDRAHGAILGKAMSGLKEGKGMVLVLVTLQ